MELERPKIPTKIPKKLLALGIVLLTLPEVAGAYDCFTEKGDGKPDFFRETDSTIRIVSHGRAKCPEEPSELLSINLYLRGVEKLTGGRLP